MFEYRHVWGTIYKEQWYKEDKKEEEEVRRRSEEGRPKHVAELVCVPLNFPRKLFSL